MFSRKEVFNNFILVEVFIKWNVVLGTYREKDNVLLYESLALLCVVSIALQCQEKTHAVDQILIEDTMYIQAFYDQTIPDINGTIYSRYKLNNNKSVASS